MMPKAVGKITESAVHLKLAVSFLMVKTVVAQGQWQSEKISIEIAVVISQPFKINNCCTFCKFISPLIIPAPVYAIIIIGTTISFAGKPKIKASKIIPSSPIIFAKGSKKSAACKSIVLSPTKTFDIMKIKSPAGAAVIKARESTKTVRSKIDLTITFKTCGLR